MKATTTTVVEIGSLVVIEKIVVRFVSMIVLRRPMVFQLPIQDLTSPNQGQPNGMKVTAILVVEIENIVVMKITITIQIVTIGETVTEIVVKFEFVIILKLQLVFQLPI
jgi:hypothetical protein